MRDGDDYFASGADDGYSLSGPERKPAAERLRALWSNDHHTSSKATTILMNENCRYPVDQIDLAFAKFRPTFNALVVMTDLFN
jgi:hypothetical protein